jgi:hypothetical protein
VTHPGACKRVSINVVCPLPPLLAYEASGDKKGPGFWGFLKKEYLAFLRFGCSKHNESYIYTYVRVYAYITVRVRVCVCVYIYTC